MLGLYEIEVLRLGNILDCLRIAEEMQPL